MACDPSYRLWNGALHGLRYPRAFEEQSRNYADRPDGWKDVGPTPGSEAGEFINWLTFADKTSSVVPDVSRVRNRPLVPRSIPIDGYVYDVRSGKLLKVPEATGIGAART